MTIITDQNNFCIFAFTVELSMFLHFCGPQPSVGFLLLLLCHTFEVMSSGQLLLWLNATFSCEKNGTKIVDIG